MLIECLVFSLTLDRDKIVSLKDVFTLQFQRYNKSHFKPHGAGNEYNTKYLKLTQDEFPKITN